MVELTAIRSLHRIVDRGNSAKYPSCSNVKNILENGFNTLNSIIGDAIAGDAKARDELISNFTLDASQVADKDSTLAWVYNDFITPIGQAAVRNTLYQDVCAPLTRAFAETDDSAYGALLPFYQHLQTLPKLPTMPAWTWQSCSELGFFESTYPGSSQPFSNFIYLTAAYLFGRACQGDFSANPPPTTDNINRNYGSLNIQTVETNVVFTHGCNDPW